METLEILGHRLRKLRKEKRVYQKGMAELLEVTLRHYQRVEHGDVNIPVLTLCTLADYFGVTTDYLLGRSPEPMGSRLMVEDIPEPDAAGKENRIKGSGNIMPVLQKKLIANSLNILFDLLQRMHNSALISELSAYLMLAVYRAFRIAY